MVALRTVAFATLLPKSTAGVHLEGLRAPLEAFGLTFDNDRGLSSGSFKTANHRSSVRGTFEYYYVTSKDKVDVSERAERFEAAAYCKSLGNDWSLLTLHSDEERDFVISRGMSLRAKPRKPANLKSSPTRLVPPLASRLLPLLH
jgi:hypothetical protein